MTARNIRLEGLRRSLPLEGIDTVLVKFYFTNRKHIPPEILEFERPPDDVIDQRHADQAVEEGWDTGRKDRLRAGRVDTGEYVIYNLGLVHADLMHRGFTDNGFGLEDIHCFEKPAKPPQRPKCVVVLSFVALRPNERFTLPTSWAVRDLAAVTWRYCHVWKNLNDVATINFVGREPDASPGNRLIVRDRIIVAEPMKVISKKTLRTQRTVVPETEQSTGKSTSTDHLEFYPGQKNYGAVAEGYHALTHMLQDFVYKTFHDRDGDKWWSAGVFPNLPHDRRGEVPSRGTDESLKYKLDVYDYLILIDRTWNRYFCHILFPMDRNNIRGLKNRRHDLAHYKLVGFDNQVAYYKLHKMVRIAQSINPSAVPVFERLRKQVHERWLNETHKSENR